MKKDYIVELREEEANELMDDHWVGELVRCKDCKYNIFDWNCNMISCLRIGQPIEYHKPDWYCADGEKREEDGCKQGI